MQQIYWNHLDELHLQIIRQKAEHTRSKDTHIRQNTTTIMPGN